MISRINSELKKETWYLIEKLPWEPTLENDKFRLGFQHCITVDRA